MLFSTEGHLLVHILRLIKLSYMADELKVIINIYKNWIILMFHLITICNTKFVPQ